MLSLKEASKLLSSKKERHETGLFIAEGGKLSKEAIGIKGALECLFMTEGFSGTDTGEELLLSCKEADVSIVPDASLKKISGLVTPEGVMAAVRTEVIRKAAKERYESAREKGFPMLFLEDLQDPGNMGTIIRTAEAAGVSKIVLSKGCVDPFSPKVVRATMGSILRAPLEECESEEGFFELISKNKDEGFVFYAAALSGKVSYSDIDYGKKICVLIGNEGRGLTEKATGCADEAILIPMEGAAESLNAGVAAAVILFEIKRQRGKNRGNERKRQDS